MRLAHLLVLTLALTPRLASADDLKTPILLDTMAKLEAAGQPAVVLSGMGGVCTGCTRGNVLWNIREQHGLEEFHAVTGQDPVEDLAHVNERIAAGTDAAGSPQARGLQVLKVQLEAEVAVDQWLADPLVHRANTVDPEAKREGEREPYLGDSHSNGERLVNREKLPDHPQVAATRAALDARGLTGWSQRPFNEGELAILKAEGIEKPRGPRMGFPFVLGYIGQNVDTTLVAPDGTKIPVRHGWAQSPWSPYKGSGDTDFDAEAMKRFTDLIRAQQALTVAPTSFIQGSGRGLFGL
jgi:hypothetical protein